MAIMRLTVGPLPAAVYWRRRVLVLSVLALLIVAASYACGGASSSTNGGAGSSAAAAGATTAATTAADAGAVPEGDGSAAPAEWAQPGGSAQPEGSAFALATTAPTEFCTDAEMTVTATAGSGSSAAGAPLELTLKFKNIGSRTCRRDIGADVQELRISQGKSLLWSSDDCNPNHGHNVRSFASNQEAVFWLRWNGSASRDSKGEVSCGSGAPIPAAGEYQLTGRLDGLVSEAFLLKVT